MTAPPTQPAAVLFGGGGHARSIHDVLTRLGWVVLALVDPRPSSLPCPRIDSDERGIEFAASHDGAVAIVAIGDNELREAVIDRISEKGVGLPPVVAATATVAADAQLGTATIILEHAHIGPRSCIGAGCIVNTGAVVEHDVTVGAWSKIGPGAVLAGESACHDRASIGAGATILPGRHVGAAAVVGAGAVVTRDVTPADTVVGVPARSRRR